MNLYRYPHSYGTRQARFYHSNVLLMAPKKIPVRLVVYIPLLICFQVKQRTKNLLRIVFV